MSSPTLVSGRSPLAVCIAPDKPVNAPRTTSDGGYIEEILDHFGLWFETIRPEDLEALETHVRLLVTVGDLSLTEFQQSGLRAWLEAGGAWLALGGLCGQEEFWGLEREIPDYRGCNTNSLCALGEGYLQLPLAAHIICGHLSLPLHYFNGLAVRPTPGAAVTVLASCLDRHGRPNTRVGLAEQTSAGAQGIFVAPDLVGSIVRIQQGVAVTRGGIPSGDGTAIVTDGWCKTDDGAVLDWDFDRLPVPGAPGLKAFLRPVADEWRELLLRCILQLARSREVPLPLLWFYPHNLPALAHISHDTDHNNPAHARHLLELLRRTGIKSTWCVILPGYAPEILAAIREAGHELATHYDAVSEGCTWDESQFQEQCALLRELFAERPVTNKNHFLRWEGDTEFFDWCVRRGIEVDQSKGASKVGEAGFNFGTCHPYRCVNRGGELLDVLEIATPTQDLAIFAPEELCAPLLRAVISNHGIFHLLFHPDHTHKPAVEAAFVRAVSLAKEAGLEFWTARQLNSWERSRRKLRWRELSQHGTTARLEVESPIELPGATFLLLASEADELTVNDGPPSRATVHRWGFEFHVAEQDVPACTGH